MEELQRSAVSMECANSRRQPLHTTRGLKLKRSITPNDMLYDGSVR